MAIEDKQLSNSISTILNVLDCTCLTMNQARLEEVAEAIWEDDKNLSEETLDLIIAEDKFSEIFDLSDFCHYLLHDIPIVYIKNNKVDFDYLINRHFIKNSIGENRFL